MDKGAKAIKKVLGWSYSKALAFVRDNRNAIRERAIKLGENKDGVALDMAVEHQDRIDAGQG